MLVFVCLFFVCFHAYVAKHSYNLNRCVEHMYYFLFDNYDLTKNTKHVRIRKKEKQIGDKMYIFSHFFMLKEAIFQIG